MRSHPISRKRSASECCLAGWCPSAANPINMTSPPLDVIFYSVRHFDAVWETQIESFTAKKNRHLKILSPSTVTLLPRQQRIHRKLNPRFHPGRGWNVTFRVPIYQN